MKNQRQLWWAFALNLVFSLVELVGGMLTGSVAIASDALHDLGDAGAIGLSLALEKKSRRPPDGRYTFGYGRFQVLGGLLTTLLLVVGAVPVTVGAVSALLRPRPIHHAGMLGLAVVGVAVNLGAVLLTRGEGIHRRALMLHMLEDVLSWLAVLVGAAVMGLTGWVWLDPVLSLLIIVPVLWGAVGNLRRGLPLLLERAPLSPTPAQVERALLALPQVRQVHQLRLWQQEEGVSCVTAHVVCTEPCNAALRRAVEALGIFYSCFQTEAPGELCPQRGQTPPACTGRCCHHRHLSGRNGSKPN